MAHHDENFLVAGANNGNSRGLLKQESLTPRLVQSPRASKKNLGLTVDDEAASISARPPSKHEWGSGSSPKPSLSSRYFAMLVKPICSIVV